MTALTHRWGSLIGRTAFLSTAQYALCGTTSLRSTICLVRHNFSQQHNMPCAAQLLSAAQYALCGTTSLSSTICLVRHDFSQQHNMPCAAQLLSAAQYALCGTTSLSSTICRKLCGTTSLSSTICLVRHDFSQQHNTVTVALSQGVLERRVSG